MLLPNDFHFPTKGCEEETHFYWIHFHTLGTWEQRENFTKSEHRQKRNPYQPVDYFNIQLQKHGPITQNAEVYEKIKQLLILENQPLASARWEQQFLLHDILMRLQVEQVPHYNSRTQIIAEKTALYLRQNYMKEINYSELGESLHFHPAYISRCMKEVFSTTPLEYLVRYRIEQAKLQLLSTDKLIGDIAEAVGFKNISYFVRCFSKYFGLTPKQYRNKYHY